MYEFPSFFVIAKIFNIAIIIQDIYIIGDVDLALVANTNYKIPALAVQLSLAHRGRQDGCRSSPSFAVQLSLAR